MVIFLIIQHPFSSVFKLIVITGSPCVVQKQQKVSSKQQKVSSKLKINIILSTQILKIILKLLEKFFKQFLEKLKDKIKIKKIPVEKSKQKFQKKDTEKTNPARVWTDKLDGCFRFGGAARDGHIGGVGEGGVAPGVHL